MKEKKSVKSILLIGVIFFISCIFVPFLSNAESAPHAFEGYATDNTGKLLKDGTSITAKVIDNFPGGDGDIEYYTTTVDNSLGGNKNYQLTVYDYEEDNRLGSGIYFFIENENTSETIVFHQGWVNNNTGDYYNITIIDIPRITNNSNTTGTTGDTFHFNVTVVDYADEPENLTVNVSWNHDSLFDNTTLIPVVGNFFGGDITLDHSIDDLTFTIWVNDTSGNMNSSGPHSVTVTDNDDPVSDVTEISGYWKKLTDNPLTITGARSDNIGLKNVTLYYYYGSTNISFTGPWAFSVNSSPWVGLSWSFTFPNASGFYRFYSRAIDNASNVEDSPVTNDTYCGYDIVAPASSVDAITPYWKTGTPTTITATASDATSGVYNVTFYYRFSPDNSSWQGWMNNGTDAASPWSCMITFANGSGYYEFYSLAVDNATNTESAGAADALCGYDYTAPSSSVAAVTPYWKTSSPTTITATASDTTSGVRNVTFYYRWSADNVSFGSWMSNGTDSASPWSRVITFANGTGYYEFYSRAYDNATNFEAAPGSKDAMCGYDFTAPLSSVTLISDYWQNTTSLVINATASDATSGVNNVTLYYYNSTDNTTWAGPWMFIVDSTSPWSWSFTFPNSTSADNHYRFYSIAQDNATNTQSAPLVNDTECFYNNTAPNLPSAPSPSNGTTYAEGSKPPSVSWTGGDIDSDVVNYTLYFRAGNSTFNSTYVLSNGTTTTRSVTTTWSTTYYWRIVATDEHGMITIGPIWHFATQSEGGGGSSPPPPSETTNHAPITDAGGPYVGYVNGTLTLSGAGSTDSDGTITGYRWDWTNDGTWDTDWLTTATTTHIYTRVGTYTVKLQVKDNGSATDDDTANVTVKPLPVIYASQEAMDFLNISFGLEFLIPFYATDTNGDGIVDTFTDPNHLLTFVRFADIDGSASFLLSTGNDNIPEFFWDTNTNTTVLLTFIAVTVAETWIDSQAGEILLITNVEKTGWVYLRMVDSYPPELYPGFNLTVKTTDNRIISPDLVWREDGYIYVLDDPAVQYIFLYTFTVLPPGINPPNGTIFAPTFTPSDGTTFDITKPTITISYFQELTLLLANLNNQNILPQITTTDHKTYVFTPTQDLAEGTYTISLTVQDSQGNTLTSTATYTISIPEEPKGTEIPWLLIIIVVILIVIAVLIILRKRLII